MNLYRILRISGGRRRRQARVLTPFVAREKDLGVLAGCSERALAGDGQFVLIVGEPGIGKSRLVEEFRGQMADRRHSWVEWSSSQLLQNTPLHPILGGGASGSADRRWHPSSAWLNSTRFSLTSISMPGSSLLFLRRWLAFRSRQGVCPVLRWRRLSRSVGRHGPVGDRRGRNQPSFSSLRTCSGSWRRSPRSWFCKTVLESRRGDITATQRTVEALLALTEELNLKTYTDLGQVYAK